MKAAAVAATLVLAIRPPRWSTTATSVSGLVRVDSNDKLELTWDQEVLPMSTAARDMMEARPDPSQECPEGVPPGRCPSRGHLGACG